MQRVVVTFLRLVAAVLLHHLLLFVGGWQTALCRPLCVSFPILLGFPSPRLCFLLGHPIV